MGLLISRIMRKFKKDARIVVSCGGVLGGGPLACCWD